MKGRTVERLGVGLFMIAAGLMIIFPRINPIGFFAANDESCSHDRDGASSQQECDKGNGPAAGGVGRARENMPAEEVRSAGNAGFGESASAHVSGGE
ncbi:hypothetical protein [Asaia sp. VD9]|uniref:hypothetical protein n=1 Tax=Asaia sp. VD9 TaxID=3081235 RepID=UPI003017F395